MFLMMSVSAVVFLILPWAEGFSWWASILIDIGILCFWSICVMVNDLSEQDFWEKWDENHPEDNDGLSQEA